MTFRAPQGRPLPRPRHKGPLSVPPPQPAPILPGLCPDPLPRGLPTPCQPAWQGLHVAPVVKPLVPPPPGAPSMSFPVRGLPDGSRGLPHPKMESQPTLPALSLLLKVRSMPPPPGVSSPVPKETGAEPPGRPCQTPQLQPAGLGVNSPPPTHPKGRHSRGLASGLFSRLLEPDLSGGSASSSVNWKQSHTQQLGRLKGMVHVQVCARVLASLGSDHTAVNPFNIIPRLQQTCPVSRPHRGGGIMSQPSRGQNSSSTLGALAATGDATAPPVCCQAGLRLRESPRLMPTPSPSSPKARCSSLLAG